MPDIIGGTAYVRIDGVQHKLRGDIKYSAADIKKESVVGADGYHGIKKMPEIPFVEMKLSDSGNLDTKRFQDMDDVTVTVELGSGKQFILSNAACMSAPENDPIAGEFSVRFEGPKGEELLASG